MLTPPPIDPFSLSSYDVIWNSPSKDAAGSMPIGNGEVVLNVWTEAKTGDLLILIARTDSFSEISRVMKLGRIRIHIDGSPFLNATDFQQRLNLRDGVINVSTANGNLRVFVDSESDVLHVRGSLVSPAPVTASYETWRKTSRELPKPEYASAWTSQNAPFPLIESGDIVSNLNGAVSFYHRNATSIVPAIWAQQTLTEAAGRFDPLTNLTFGGVMRAPGFQSNGLYSLTSRIPMAKFDVSVATLSKITPSGFDWVKQAQDLPIARPGVAEARTRQWWNRFWNRSEFFAVAETVESPVPKNDQEIRYGLDSNGQNRFPGEITNPKANLSGGNLDLFATITPTSTAPGRIFDKLTAGQSDGFLFDTHPGNCLRLIIGDMTLVSPPCLTLNQPQTVRAVYNAKTGAATLYRNGKVVAERSASDPLQISRSYNLQRYVQACQGRGKYPIKFNGGYFTVEPVASGMDFNPDWRRWGDCFWYQNVRHMYHPMLATGDFDLMDPFFRLYEAAVPLAKSRTKIYHGASGAYFPETMTAWGTFGGQDYGWDRTGLEPKDVQCPWWDDAWNQGPELVNLMLDYYDYTKNEKFLRERVLPLANAVLTYFDTRFKKDARGKIILDPTQVVETYWTGVVNDAPTVAGLIAVTSRLTKLPIKSAFFTRMAKACPDLPMEVKNGQRKLSPAKRYNPTTSNVENGELYGVWPFRVVSLSRPKLLTAAINSYDQRLNRLDNGWGYDGNVAALLGLTDEAARILTGKCQNSNAAYRWPATWGPNFDWLPDQNHGGNILNTTNLMLLQCEGDAIRLFPAWPQGWDAKFKLHAPKNTIVEATLKNGKITYVLVTPASRQKDIVLPSWAKS